MVEVKLKRCDQCSTLEGVSEAYFDGPLRVQVMVKEQNPSGGAMVAAAITGNSFRVAHLCRPCFVRRLKDVLKSVEGK